MTTANRLESDDRGYQRRIRSWMIYSWGLDGMITSTLVTFFPPFFVAVAAPALLAADSHFKTLADAREGVTNIFSLVVSGAVVVALILAPIAGTYADLTGRRKRTLLAVTAINGGNLAYCLVSDQRGFPRAGVCDIGAYEYTP
jgi:MFS-type transporter involved in bile tolerance (Atg22 family)